MTGDNFGADKITIQQIADEMGCTDIERALLESCSRDYVFENLDAFADLFDVFSELDLVKMIIDIRELDEDPDNFISAHPIFDITLEHIEAEGPFDEIDQELIDRGFHSIKIGNIYFLYSAEPRPALKP